MRWQAAILGLLVIAAVALTACAGAATSQAPVPPEIPGEDGRLVRFIIGDGPGGKICFYDADVRFEDGRVGGVASAGELAKDRIRTGDPIVELPPEMRVGTTAPFPVYLGDDGKIRPGYEYCEAMP